MDPVGDGFLDVYLHTADGVDEVSKAHHVDHGVVLDVQVEVVADHGLEGVRGRVAHGRVDRQFPRVVGHRLVDVVEQQIEAHRLRITFGQLGVLGKLCVFHVARQSHQDGVTGGGVDAGHHHGVGSCPVALGVGVRAEEKDVDSIRTVPGIGGVVRGQIRVVGRPEDVVEGLVGGVSRMQCQGRGHGQRQTQTQHREPAREAAQERGASWSGDGPGMYDDRQPQHGDGEDHPHGREQPSTAHCHTGHRCEGGGLDETHPVSPPEQSNDPAEIHQQDQCAREAAPHPQVGDARKGDRHGCPQQRPSRAGAGGCFGFLVFPPLVVCCHQRVLSMAGADVTALEWVVPATVVE